MQPRATASRRKDAIATRAKLVRAALDLFTVDGYRGTTTLEIASRAQTAEATIYRHFVGKDALYNEALRESLRLGLGLVREGEGLRGPGCRERLRQLGRRLVEHAAVDAPLVTMLFRRGPAPALEESSALLAREFRDGIVQMIAAGKQEGVFRTGSADLWTAVWLAIVGFVVERVVAKEWSADHPSVGLTLDGAWDAIAYRAAGPG
jgi:AcrR family transcriptional regulator